MENLLLDLQKLNLQKRVVGVIENGSWSPEAGEAVKAILGKMKQMTVLNEEITINSSLNDMTYKELDGFADSLIDSMKQSYFE